MAEKLDRACARAGMTCVDTARPIDEIQGGWPDDAMQLGGRIDPLEKGRTTAGIQTWLAAASAQSVDMDLGMEFYVGDTIFNHPLSPKRTWRSVLARIPIRSGRYGLTTGV